VLACPIHESIPIRRVYVARTVPKSILPSPAACRVSILIGVGSGSGRLAMYPPPNEPTLSSLSVLGEHAMPFRNDRYVAHHSRLIATLVSPLVFTVLGSSADHSTSRSPDYHRGLADCITTATALVIVRGCRDCAANSRIFPQAEKRSS